MPTKMFNPPTMHGTSPLRSDKLGMTFDHPAKHLTRGVNDPMGGPQHRDSAKKGGACRKKEAFNPMKAPAPNL